MKTSIALDLKGLISLQSLPVDDLIITPNFFVAIFAGVFLALAFQFILTAISVAAGVTAIGNLKESHVDSKVNPSENKVKERYNHDQDDSSDMSMGVKITTGFGIWSVATTCIALFGATALALNLSVVESPQTNVVTSLVIWAIFFLILFYLETRVASTLIGNLVSAATSGLKNSASAIGSMFAPSQEAKLEKVIDNTIDRVRSEFDSGLNSDKLSNVLDNFLQSVDRKVPDYDDLKNDLEGIAKKSGSKNTSGKWMAVQQVLTKAISENEASNDSEKKGKAAKLKEVLNTVKERYDASPGKAEGVKNVVEEFSSLEKREIEDRIQQIQEYLSTSGDEKLTTDQIEKKFRAILDNPSMISSLIATKYENLDRQRIVGLLDRNTNLDKKKIDSYADTIESSIHKITQEFDNNIEQRMVKRMETRVSDFFNKTERPELDYALLKNDVKQVMDNPKDGLDVIKKRFSTFDTETLKAVVTNNQYVDEENINQVVSTIEDGKKEVLDKIQQIETTANQQIEKVKRKAVIQAEHARATASSAAWWLVLSTILSGVAAMAGSAVVL